MRSSVTRTSALARQIMLSSIDINASQCRQLAQRSVQLSAKNTPTLRYGARTHTATHGLSYSGSVELNAHSSCG